MIFLFPRWDMLISLMSFKRPVGWKTACEEVELIHDMPEIMTSLSNDLHLAPLTMTTCWFFFQEFKVHEKPGVGENMLMASWWKKTYMIHIIYPSFLFK